MKNILKSAIATSLLISAGAYADISQIKEAINVSGQTRAYSQTLAVAYINKCFNSKKTSQLEQVMSTMDRTWIDLSNYEPVKGSKELTAATKAMASEWSTYKTLLASECSKDNAKKVYVESDNFGSNADTYVSTLQKAIGKSAGAKLVNQAGRQRFYIMAIAKYNEMARAGLISDADAGSKIESIKTKWLQSQKELKAQTAGKPEIDEILDTATTHFKNVVQNLHKRDGSLDVMFDSLYDIVNQQVRMFEAIE